MSHIKFESTPTDNEESWVKEFYNMERRARQDLMEVYSQLNQEEVQAWLYGDFTKKETELTDIAAAVKDKFNRANDDFFADVMFPKLDEFKGSVTSDACSMVDIKVDVNTIRDALHELRSSHVKREKEGAVFSSAEWNGLDSDSQLAVCKRYHVQIVDKIGGIVNGGII